MNSRSRSLCHRLSVCLSVCLSSVVYNVRAPYSTGWNFYGDRLRGTPPKLKTGSQI